MVDCDSHVMEPADTFRKLAPMSIKPSVSAERQAAVMGENARLAFGL